MLSKGPLAKSTEKIANSKELLAKSKLYALCLNPPIPPLVKGGEGGLLLVYTLCFLLFALPLEAKVTGNCVNCHTMHNSQNGQPMAYDFNGTSFSKTTTPKGNLLIYSCLGCHSATDGTTWQDSITKAPIVFNTSAPQYGASSDGGTTYQGLAGGNFYWVKTEDTKGHNIFANNPEDTLNPVRAPGDAGFYSCTTDSCHANIHGTVSGTTNDNLNGRQGCTKCHMMKSLKGYHHADDGTGTKYVDTEAKGWYRFLAGLASADGLGVKGIEDSDWQKTSSATDHNEYLGNPADKTLSSSLMGGIADNQTTTAYCCGCHGNFHIQDTTAVGVSPWLRHPSDFVIPNSGEYTAISTTYNPDVPVARSSAFMSGLGNTPDGTVQAGRDMVMCLSCHRAHGSPYFKLMRWDYKGWPAAGTNGCAVCHTSKN